MKKRIYIAGCGGMLGEAFYQNYKEDYDIKCTDKEVNEEWLTYLDFRDYTAYRKDVKEFEPDYLFHLGAYTDLEYCEKNPIDTYNTNTLAVENAVHIANELDIPLLYISTAGIFDGEKQVYDDWDVPNPLGIYGKTKYHGEKYVVENAYRHLVCRAGWMMGGGPRKDIKFIQKIMSQLRSGADNLFIVNDKFGTPTYTHDFANNVKVLLEKEMWGLFNMVCGGQTSRIEVTREILKILKIQDKVRITTVDSSFFKEIYFAKRPHSEQLVNKKLQLRKLDLMRDWKTTLNEYLTNYYQGYLTDSEVVENRKIVPKFFQKIGLW